MVVPGRCSLCFRHGELQESHVVPRWAYKKLHGDSAAPSTPVHLQAGRAFQSPRQIKEHLLCTDCEQQLGRIENIVAKMVAGRHPFRTLLPDRTWDAPSNVWLADASSIDIKALCAFAVSVFWRASVARAMPLVALGEYEETCRRYLHGTTPFPENARLVVSAFESDSSDEHPLAEVVRFPEKRRLAGHLVHVAMICGLEFLFAVGQRHLPGMNSLCLHHAESKRVVLIVGTQDAMTGAVGSLAVRAKVRGALAEKASFRG